MKKLLIAFVILSVVEGLPLLSTAQGIKFEEGLSWAQIKQKAKAENKYIFLDIYTTWCGPCKMMDKNVFVDDNVGYFFNDKFIAVKVQIDKTPKDDGNIKSWYTDAATISKQYKIAAYPTFIFLNPLGETTDIQTGYHEPKPFLDFAKASTKPGKLYKDPDENYTRLLYDYNNGIINYDSLDYMYLIARKLNDSIMKPQLMKTYVDYISSLKPAQRYTKKNVQFWSSLNLSSRSLLFPYILHNDKRIDRVMYKGFAFTMLNKIVQNELVAPFLQEENKNKSLSMTGYYTTGGDVKTDSSEADWKKLYAIIQKKYNKTLAERAVLLSRIEWYKRHFNNEGMVSTWLVQEKKYPQDLQLNFFDINNQAWNAFEKSRDEKTLTGYMRLMKVLVEGRFKDPTMMDTYANLLYKVGKVQAAITWQEKASQLLPKNKDYIVAIEQMKKGSPTYGVQPLNN